MLPASERNLYAEPKRLAAAGLVRMRREQVGRRNRTIYEITPAGREALRRQLATLPAPPQLEFEALQRLVFADQGSKQDLLAALDTTSEQVEQLLEDGMAQVRGYQDDGGPFPSDSTSSCCSPAASPTSCSCCATGSRWPVARRPAGRPPATSASPTAPGGCSRTCSSSAISWPTSRRRPPSGGPPARARLRSDVLLGVALIGSWSRSWLSRWAPLVTV